MQGIYICVRRMRCHRPKAHASTRLGSVWLDRRTSATDHELAEVDTEIHALTLAR